MSEKTKELSGVIWNLQFWKDDSYRQRITREEWKEALLQERDRIIVRGNIRQLKAKNLGCGVYEISMEKMEDGK